VNISKNTILGSRLFAETTTFALNNKNKQGDTSMNKEEFDIVKETKKKEAEDIYKLIEDDYAYDAYMKYLQYCKQYQMPPFVEKSSSMVKTGELSDSTNVINH
jgi:hypothetical protein